MQDLIERLLGIFTPAPRPVPIPVRDEPQRGPRR